MWPLSTGQNNTVQFQAILILGCVRYIGGTKSGFLTRPGMEFFWKAPEPKVWEFGEHYWQLQQRFHHGQNLVETGT